MIEIKFTTSEGEKHLGIIPTHVASSIQDACELIQSNVTLSMATVYSIKQCDIADIQARTEEDSDGGAYYKAVIKYATIDNKVAKYSFLTWAKDLDDAKDRVSDLIEQNGLELAEVTKLEKTSYTAVLDEEWFDIELEVAAICADINDIDMARIKHKEGDYKVRSEAGIELLLHVRNMTGLVNFERLCDDCGCPMYYDDTEREWRCKTCGYVGD